MIGGRASFVGAACPSRFCFSTVVVQFFRDRALGVARAVAFPPTGCQASVHPHYCLLGFSHQNSPTVCAWLVRHGRRACGVWQAPNAINSTIWRHFVPKIAINIRKSSSGGSGARARKSPRAGAQRLKTLGLRVLLFFERIEALPSLGCKSPTRGSGLGPQLAHSLSCT